MKNLEIDEKFVINNTKDKTEYLSKIDAYINSVPNFKPEYTHQALTTDRQRSTFLYYNRELLGKIDGVLLIGSYFATKSLDEGSYYSYYIVYSKKYDKNLIIRTYPYAYQQGTILNKDSLVSFTIEQLRTLYKRLIVQTKSITQQVRQIKKQRDEFLEILQNKYHFNSQSNKLCRISDFAIDMKSGIVKTITYNVCSFRKCYCDYSTNSVIRYNQPYEKILKHLTTVYDIHTNDFTNVIQPALINKMNEEYEKLMEKNNATISNFV